MASYKVTYKWGGIEKSVYINDAANENEAVLIANTEVENNVPSTASVEIQFICE